MASMSPVNARRESAKSKPEMTRTPLVAKTMPTIAAAPGLIPRNRSMRTTQMSCVVTSAVAAATLVSFSDETQVAKCAASMVPAKAASNQSRAFIAPISSRRRTTATGAIAAVPKALRQKAIVSAGALVAAINGPDAETPRTAITARSAFTRSVCRRVAVRLAAAQVVPGSASGSDNHSDDADNDRGAVAIVRGDFHRVLGALRLLQVWRSALASSADNTHGQCDGGLAESLDLGGVRIGENGAVVTACLGGAFCIVRVRGAIQITHRQSGRM